MLVLSAWWPFGAGFGVLWAAVSFVMFLALWLYFAALWALNGYRCALIGFCNFADRFSCAALALVGRVVGAVWPPSPLGEGLCEVVRLCQTT